jgi:hypothetical protein
LLLWFFASKKYNYFSFIRHKISKNMPFLKNITKKKHCTVLLYTLVRKSPWSHKYSCRSGSKYWKDNKKSFNNISVKPGEAGKNYTTAVFLTSAAYLNQVSSVNRRPPPCCHQTWLVDTMHYFGCFLWRHVHTGEKTEKLNCLQDSGDGERLLPAKIVRYPQEVHMLYWLTMVQRLSGGFLEITLMLSEG